MFFFDHISRGANTTKECFIMSNQQKQVRDAWHNIYDLIKNFGCLQAYEKDIEVIRNLVVDRITEEQE